jgi:hypothetical protein
VVGQTGAVTGTQILADTTVAAALAGKETAGAAAAVQASSAQRASNLSDLSSASTARTNLGLGAAAVLNVGTTAGTVAAGDDSRIVAAASGGVAGSLYLAATYR